MLKNLRIWPPLQCTILGDPFPEACSGDVAAAEKGIARLIATLATEGG